MKQVKCLLGGQRVRVGSENHTLVVVSVTLLDISSGFPLDNHLTLPGSESVFGISQGPSMCVRVHLIV